MFPYSAYSDASIFVSPAEILETAAGFIPTV